MDINQIEKSLARAVEPLMAADDEAIGYFTRRDLLAESVPPIMQIQDLPVPHKILRSQTPDGFWKGPAVKNAVFPSDHADLVATFKSFRLLVERYQLNRDFPAIAKAAEYLFSFQTSQGDIRGFIGNQYATYYTGYSLALLIQAGYAADLRVENGIQWLLKMRQDDGGWSIPILTHYLDGKTLFRLTSSYAEPLEPDRSQPFSHNWTDMVLRAFAQHPVHSQSEDARQAAALLKSRFFQPDVYNSYRYASYWTRFIHWWPNLLTALESLSKLDYNSQDPDIRKGLHWFVQNQKADGLWECAYGNKPLPLNRGYPLERAWISLRTCRMLKRYLYQRQPWTD